MLAEQSDTAGALSEINQQLRDDILEFRQKSKKVQKMCEDEKQNTLVMIGEVHKAFNARQACLASKERTVSWYDYLNGKPSEAVSVV